VGVARPVPEAPAERPEDGRITVDAARKGDPLLAKLVKAHGSPRADIPRELRGQ